MPTSSAPSARFATSSTTWIISYNEERPHAALGTSRQPSHSRSSRIIASGLRLFVLFFEDLVIQILSLHAAQFCWRRPELFDHDQPVHLIDWRKLGEIGD
jgi:hypothetical protein